MKSTILATVIALALSACSGAPQNPNLLATCVESGNSEKVCKCAITKLQANADPAQLKKYIDLTDYSSQWAKKPEGKAALEEAAKDGPLAQAKLVFEIVAQAEKETGMEPGEGKIIASRLGSMFLTDSVKACQA